MSPADPASEYAYWTEPTSRFTVTYSLGVFHEIDFEVSEGFRRIPHGGVETGGLLFGHLAQEGPQLSARIEAFRTIECEHASGPSFTLSERDVAGIRNQLTAAASDPELRGLEVLGWFVAHTRSALEMNEREAALFEQLFPGPGRLLMLVKPERFQATRFAFLMRDGEGRIEREAAGGAIILPLPGRAGRTAQGPAASIPAPQASAPAPPVASPKEIAPSAPANELAWPAPAAPAKEVTSPGPPRAVAPASVAPSFWREVPAPAGAAEPVVRIEEPERAQDFAETTALAVRQPARDALRRSRAGNLAPEPDELRDEQQRITRKMRRAGRLSALRLAVLLLVAAGLGCGVGYFAYLQLPPATIALTVQREPATATAADASVPVIVSWPADETRDALYASLRVDDGEPIPLSRQQREAGRLSLPVSSDNVKIELIAQRRWRDSRGIVRYVRAKNVTP